MSEIVAELATSKNDKGFDHARALIRQGKISESASWDGPEAGAENRYIEENGWSDFSKWYMGKNPEYNPESKAHWKYPFSSDFKTVSLNGLKAIRSRAGQTKETEIFNAAGKLLEMAAGDDEKASALTERQTFSTFCLEAQAPSKVDREAGTIEQISILTAGEAKGHNMMISQKTLESSITLLIGKQIPAYLSHSGAMGDRLLTEAGYFSGFYRDKDKIRATRFVALESFKKYEPEKYDRLFEIAEVAPQSFGVSIVFEGQLFWEMADGSEVGMDVGLEAPENARFGMPTVRPLKITSADFVDTPAANGALFSGKVDIQTNSKDMNTDEKVELGEPSPDSASARHISDEEKIAPPVPTPEPQPKPKKKAKKKALAEQDEEDREDEERGEEDEIAKEDQGEEVAEEEDDAEERDDDEMPDADKLEEKLERPDDEYQEKMRAAVEEVYSHIENSLNRLREVMDMVGVPDTRASEKVEASANAELIARVEELEKLGQGTTPPIAEKSKNTFATIKEAKAHLIKDHLDKNPSDTRATAVLAVGKTNPELFQQN